MNPVVAERECLPRETRASRGRLHSLLQPIHSEVGLAGSQVAVAAASRGEDANAVARSHELGVLSTQIDAPAFLLDPEVGAPGRVAPSFKSSGRCVVGMLVSPRECGVTPYQRLAFQREYQLATANRYMSTECCRHGSMYLQEFNLTHNTISSCVLASTSASLPQ